MYLGIIGQGSEEPGARQRILEGLELFAQTKTQVTAVMMKVIVAEQLLEISDDDEVTSLLDSAESDADTRGERFYLPELWRVRGRVSARQGDVPAAERAYRMAFDIATEQKAHSLALRAALDMYDLLAAAGRVRRAATCCRRHQQRGRGVDLIARSRCGPAPSSHGRSSRSGASHAG